MVRRYRGETTQKIDALFVIHETGPGIVEDMPQLNCTQSPLQRFFISSRNERISCMNHVFSFLIWLLFYCFVFKPCSNVWCLFQIQFDAIQNVHRNDILLTLPNTSFFHIELLFPALTLELCFPYRRKHKHILRWR